MGRMRHLDVAAEFPAAPTAAWRLLVDTRTWSSWGPTILDVACDPPLIGPGRHGRIRTVAGVWVPFEVTGFEPGVSWHWRVAGVPATGHRVEPTATGVRVVFEVPVLAAPYTAVCRLALRRIGRVLADPVDPDADDDAGTDPDSAERS
ncbi:MAG: SRPBCC family protein [Nitriliruptoraceae bacterium]|nr:SRPBCC family protein [Nitriliruptoraceae bacterium]